LALVGEVGILSAANATGTNHLARGADARRQAVELPRRIADYLARLLLLTRIRDSLPILPEVGGLLVGFLVFVLIARLGLLRVFHLPARSGRALVFSLGTRNSFVALPLALTLSPEWRLAIVVIVFQSLVELLGVLVYLKAVPRLLPVR